MARRVALVLITLFIVSGIAAAQTGGQLWVRSFDDRNGNGVRDSGEPLLSSGISVNLLDSQGVVIASALLDSSPNAAQGLVGFQLLPPGQYSVQVTSADYSATTQDMFTITVSDTGVPPVVEFGAQPLEIPASELPEAAGAVEGQPLALAAGGALAVMCVMVLVGIVLYFLVLRRRFEAPLGDRRTTTGSMRPVATGTGQYPVQSGTGEFRRPSDTGEFRTGTGEIDRTTGEQPRH